MPDRMMVEDWASLAVRPPALLLQVGQKYPIVSCQVTPGGYIVEVQTERGTRICRVTSTSLLELIGTQTNATSGAA